MSVEKDLPVWAALMVLAVVICGSLFAAQRYEMAAAENVGVTVMMGVVVAFFGWMKNNPPETFSPTKFVITPLIGILAGLMSAFMGYSYEQTVTWLVSSGLMLWIEFAGKSIVRRLWA